MRGYYCPDCGELFEYQDYPEEEPTLYCYKCHEYLKECEDCEICGDNTAIHRFGEDGMYLCKFCHEDIAVEVQSAVEDLQTYWMRRNKKKIDKLSIYDLLITVSEEAL